MIFKRRWKRKIYLDSTPMADIVFLLLIFFMLTSSFVIESGVKIELPKTVSTQQHIEKQLIITITRDNVIYLNKKKVKKDDLPEKLKEAIGNNTDKFIIVKADKSVLHGLVVEIMDMAKLAGAKKLAIATEQKKP